MKRIMKKLPVGIQTIEKVIEEGFVYVDKTDLIHKLITEGTYYFLSRPRRFGKSLLLSTFKAIFSADKKLFKKYKISSLAYSWEKFPTISLDFTQIPTKSPEALEAGLKRAFIKIAKSYDKTIKIASLQEGLADLVEKLAEEGKVVILVDEYDKPIIDNINSKKIAEANRALLKDVFGVLKGLDRYLRFVFVTGVSKFSQVSLFSGFNNLRDITMAPDYATLLGYTEEEVVFHFQDHLKKISTRRAKDKLPSSKKAILQEMKKWYNGYHFSWDRPAVYNPHSTLNFLETGRIQSFWFQTGTPTFLIEFIKKEKYPLEQLSDIEVGEEIFDSYDIENINPISMMWQTGYLTIQGYDSFKRLYRLGYPNEEVREAFLKRLAEGITGVMIPQVTNYARVCVEALQEKDLELFFIKLKAFFATIPYDMRLEEEKYYQTTFYVLAQLMGLAAEVEIKTNLGRIDMAIEMDKIFYIFEFKVNQKASPALKQIQDKKYLEKYLGRKKEICAIGVSFSTKERNIVEWKSKFYNFRGAKKKVLRKKA